MMAGSDNPTTGESTVKSARRVLEVLEYFAEQHAPASVTQISTALDYPQSSTSMLLASLESLGYLQQDPKSRRYRPTLRVMLLGTAMHDELFGQGSLLSGMDRLRRCTGQAVMLGLRQGIFVRFILSLRSSRPNALHYPAGVLRPVCRSAVGKMLLTRESDAEVQRIARHANAKVSDRRDRVDVAELVAEVRLCRDRGWAETIDYPQPASATLAVLLLPLADQPAMGVTLGMRIDTINAQKQSLLAALGEITQALGKS